MASGRAARWIKVHFDSRGNATVGPQTIITAAAEAGLPAIAVAANGVVGILYDTVGPIGPDGFPVFVAHLAQSANGGHTFFDQVLQTFESPELSKGDTRQRVLGDYQQLVVVGNTFYGVFSGNRAVFGSSVSEIDPIFFSTPALPPITLRLFLPLTPNQSLGHS